MKKKILLQTINYPGIGGIERSLYYLKKELGGSHEVTIISATPSEGRGNNLGVVHFPIIFNWIPLVIIRELLSYLCYIKKNKSFFDSFDVFLSRYKAMSVAITYMYPNKRHIFIPPSVCRDFYDGVLYSIERHDKGLKKHLKKLKYKCTIPLCEYFEKYILARECQIITFSENVKNSLLEKHNTINTIAVHPPGLDSVFFHPVKQRLLGKLKRFLGISNSDFVVLFVGRVSYGKNIDLLIKAFNDLNVASKKLIIVGSGEMLSAITVNEEIIAVGSKNIHKLRYFYSLADVSVIPTFYEGFGQTIIESLACGTPVAGFASKRTAIKEILVDEACGQIALTSDGEGLKSAIEKIHNKKATYKHNRIKLASKMHKKYNWQKFIDIMEIS